MIRFEKLFVPEYVYPYENAKAFADYANGTFGDVTDGVFKAGVGFKAIMQIEKMNDMHTDEFKVNKDEDVRVADLAKADGQIVNVTADELPATYAVGNILVANNKGTLVVNNEATEKCLEIIEITNYGVRATIVA